MITTRAAALVAILGGLIGFGLVGCHVQVDKQANGDDKNVKVDTPFGNIHVKTDQTDATAIGLPTYPGAHLQADHDDDKSADVQLGFGPFQMRVHVVNYATPDAEDKVVQFYRNQLGPDVIECRGNTAVGQPTHTSAGLGCSDKGDHQEIGDHDLLLKSGSEHKQRIVAFKSDSASKSGPTKFALIALTLPRDSGNSD